MNKFELFEDKMMTIWRSIPYSFMNQYRFSNFELS